MEALKPTTNPAQTEADTAADALRVHDAAAGALAAAQGWNCVACGLTVAGGVGLITLATAASDTGARTGVVPVVMHDACIDDARWTGDLKSLAGIYEDGAAGANAEAAKNARIGALVHGVDEAQRTLTRFPKLAADADLSPAGWPADPAGHRESPPLRRGRPPPQSGARPHRRRVRPRPRCVLPPAPHRPPRRAR